MRTHKDVANHFKTTTPQKKKKIFPFAWPLDQKSISESGRKIVEM